MSSPVAFITGIAGFAGSHLAEELLDHGFSVTGAVLKGEPTDNIAAIKKQVTVAQLNILNAGSCRRVIKKFRPDFIFHLAAFASVGKSFQNERLVYRVNFGGTLNMLMAALEIQNLEKFVFVSSSDCYGSFSPKNRTLTEAQPLNPLSPYGISKAAAEFACLAYVKRYELPVVIARSFNHSGPRQSEDFVIPSLAKQIAMIEKGKAEPVVNVGDLSVKRDLSDVRDVVRGYRLLARKGQPSQVYQFCSGRAVSIGSVLKQLISLSNVAITVKTDPTRLRKSDIPVLRGNHRRAARKLGYKVRYNLRQTLESTLDYWREKI